MKNKIESLIILLLALYTPFQSIANTQQNSFKDANPVQINQKEFISKQNEDISEIVVDSKLFTASYKFLDVIQTHRVILGRIGYATPKSEYFITHVIVNPIWYVPDKLKPKIVNNIIKSGEQGTYVSDNGFKFIDISGSYVSVVEFKKHPNKYDVIQMPSNTNPMGKFHFVLSGIDNIQMHDTNDKFLFNYDDRKYSAGCIRIDNATILASRLTGIDGDRLNNMIDSDKTTVLKLNKQVKLVVK